MTDRREGPDFIVDSSGNIRDVRQTGYAPSLPPPGKPPGNGRGSQPPTRPPQKSGGTPYLIPIPIGLIFWLIVALIRGCDATETRTYVPPPQSHNDLSSLRDFSDFGRGSRAFFLGEYDEAIRLLTAALDSHTPVGEVYSRRALAYHGKGEYEKALQDFDQALSLDSTPAMVHNNRAITYLAMGDYVKAMAALDRAIELQSTLGKAHYNRGLIHSSLGEYDAAIAALSQALLCSAPEPSPLFPRIPALTPGSTIDKMLKASEMERRFLETCADEPSTLYQRALAYHAQGEVDDAIEDLDMAIELLSKRLPETTPLPSPTGSFALGESTVASEEENRVQDPRVDLPSVYYFKALIYAETGEYDQASAELDKALEVGLDSDAGQQLRLFLTTWAPGAQHRPSVNEPTRRLRPPSQPAMW